jgi:uncharacterized protein (TIGR00369 family)
MRKIINPFRSNKGYNCFGCSPDNRLGLQMNFFDDGEFVTCDWEPKDHFQGYINILHGGIQSTLIDEIASWACYIKLEAAGVTLKMNVDFKRPVYVNQGIVHLKARINAVNKNIASVKVELFDSTQKLCSEGMVDYYLLPKEKAAKELLYPGIEKFFDE